MIAWLAAVLLAAYVVSAALSGAWWDIPASELLAQGASFGPAVAGGESWRLISAGFLHGGLPHLMFNLLALWEIGRPVERQLGRWITLTIFLLAASSGFFASLFWHADSISVGASGGIFGLLGGWAVLMWRALRRRGEQRAGSAYPDAAATYPEPDTAVRRGRAGIVIVLLFALGSGFLIPNVDHAAHLGGLAVGLLLGGLATPPTRAKWRSLVFFASVTTLAGGLLLATRQLPAEWRIEYRESRDYAAFYRAFASEDRAISAALQAIGEASRQNQLSDAEGLARLDGELLPRLAATAKKLHEASWQTERIARDAGRWTQYAELRLAAVSALRDAIASADPASAGEQLDRFERLMTEAAQLAHDAGAKDAASRLPADR